MSSSTKAPTAFCVTSYERDAIRPHVLGKFEDLLVATAKSPAMLFYLDNWLSVGPHSEVAIGTSAAGTRQAPPRTANAEASAAAGQRQAQSRRAV